MLPTVSSSREGWGRVLAASGNSLNRSHGQRYQSGWTGLFIEVHPDPDKALCDGPEYDATGCIGEIVKDMQDLDELIRVS